MHISDAVTDLVTDDDMTMTPDDRRRLRSLRARAARRGLGVLLSRKAISPDQIGGVMIADLSANTVIAGPCFNLSIPEAETVVAETIAGLEKAAADMLSGVGDDR